MSIPTSTNGQIEKRLAIMQPYLFPYIGYFQLINAVDRFVFYDDVNYIKGGWINRNRFLLNGNVNWLTIPLQNASSFKKINETRIQTNDKWRKKTLQSVKAAYAKAPFFEKVFELLDQIIMSEEDSISALAQKSVVLVSNYVGITTDFVASTKRYGNENLAGSRRIIDICLQENATVYHNLPGGSNLYCKNEFSSFGIDLRFINPMPVEYPQMKLPFTPSLSILDVLMFNSPKSTLQMIKGSS